MTITLEQVQKLHDEGLNGNIKSLVSLMLSLPEFTSPLKDDFQIVAKKYQLLVYYGDALYDDESYKRAEVQYSEAIKLWKVLAKMKPKSITKQPGLTAEVEIKFKVYQCYMKLREHRLAITVLTSIPPKQRSPKINMMLGKLYQRHGMERSAIMCYKEVLRSSSVALEAAMCLLNLGVTLQEVNALVNGIGSSNAMPPPEWFVQYLKGYAFSAANKHSKAIQIYKSLEIQTLRENTSLLCTLGSSHFHCGDKQNAVACFEKVRLLDKLCLDGMDIYSQILAEESRKDQLEKLAQELSEVSQNKSEAWVALSHYCSCTNQNPRAVYFAQKAHMTDVTNIHALILKASLLKALSKDQEALIHYREAVRLAPNQFEPYQGLVECHISSEKYKEAMSVARNAHKTLGANARTLTLCAKVYSQEQQTQEKAKTMLKKALSHDACYLTAVYLLCEILMKEENYNEASQILGKQLEQQKTAKLYRMNGDCLKELGQAQQGLHQYSKALRLDPDNYKALDGIQGVERDATSVLDNSVIGVQEPGDRSSMEDLDTVGSEVQRIG